MAREEAVEAAVSYASASMVQTVYGFLQSRDRPDQASGVALPAAIAFGFFGAPLNDINPIDVVKTDFASGVGGIISGKWDSPEGNNTTLTAQLANLLEGNAYVDFHTSQFVGGEIRGQLAATPLPGTLSLLATGLGALALFGCRRKRKQAA